MIRLILVALLIGLYLILAIPVMLFLKATNENHKERNDLIASRMVRWIFKLVLGATGSRVTVTGKEHIPDEPVLYVANHRSYFDIVSGYANLDTPCGFVAKKEMERFPLLRDWMRLISCLFLDRKNVKEGLKTILQGIDMVKKGTSIWIFPEGTRSQTEEMLEFKEGSMKISEKSGCAIIPVAFKGTDDVFEKHVPYISPSHIQIQFGEPIYPKQLSKEEKKFLGAYVRNKIQHMMDEME
ncbi:MAG: lysophospholipid acyltransferase family protein [Lachnospiraceae bacterium]|nr:lysophospholipid acyltransferase family protein [Lachnospiraceae bacterium]